MFELIIVVWAIIKTTVWIIVFIIARFSATSCMIYMSLNCSAFYLMSRPFCGVLFQITFEMPLRTESLLKQTDDCSARVPGTNGISMLLLTLAVLPVKGPILQLKKWGLLWTELRLVAWGIQGTILGTGKFATGSRSGLNLVPDAYVFLTRRTSPEGWSGQIVMLTTHLPLVPRLRISGDISAFPHYALIATEHLWVLHLIALFLYHKNNFLFCKAFQEIQSL
jgi:hypothetical protein